MHVHRVVEIDAGENREDEGLENSNDDLQSRERNHETCRCNLPPGEHHGKACRKPQHGVARHHVGERTNGVTDGRMK